MEKLIKNNIKSWDDLFEYSLKNNLDYFELKEEVDKLIEQGHIKVDKNNKFVFLS